MCHVKPPPLNPPPVFMYVLSATRTMHIISVLVPHLTCLLQRSPNCSPPHHCGRGNHHQEVGRPPSPLPPGLRLLQVKDRGSREQTAQHAFRDPPVPAHPGRAGGGRVSTASDSTTATPAAGMGAGKPATEPGSWGSTLPPPEAVSRPPPAWGLHPADAPPVLCL